MAANIDGLIMEERQNEKHVQKPVHINKRQSSRVFHSCEFSSR